MIISDDHRFVFVHIPKCAGTSVREQLKQHDSTRGSFSGQVLMHPELGRIDTAHLPLRILREYFPSAFEKIQSYRSFAIVRDPFERFPSSVFQRLSMHEHRPLDTLPQAELEDKIYRLIESLRAHRHAAILPYDLIHFQPQSSFVTLDGSSFVSDLYPIEGMGSLIEELNRCLGLPGDDERALKSASLGRSKQYRSSFIRLLDEKIPRRLRNGLLAFTPREGVLAARRFIFKPTKARFSHILSNEKVAEFLHEFYADDLKLYDSANKMESEVSLAGQQE